MAFKRTPAMSMNNFVRLLSITPQDFVYTPKTTSKTPHRKTKLTIKEVCIVYRFLKQSSNASNCYNEVF